MKKDEKHLIIPIKLHRQLKKYAKSHGLTLRGLAKIIIQTWLENKGLINKQP